MKPFIKPRSSTPAAGSTPQARVSPNELTILAVAGAIADSGECIAYLDRVCADDADLRARVEKRLAERSGAMSPATVQRAELMPTTTQGQGGAVAIVPMANMQLTPAGQPAPRQSAFPWLLATLLAAAVGALVVVISLEKTARAVADNQARAAVAAKETAEAERANALAGAMEYKTVTARTEEKRAEAERQRFESDTRRNAAEVEVQKAKTEAKEGLAAAVAAKAELEKSRQQLVASTEAQKAWRAELANTLGKYASTLLEQGRHGEAEGPARQAFDLRTAMGASDWAAHDARFTLAAAIMGKGDVAGAEKELLAAIAGMEPLLPQAAEPQRARYAAAVKKLAQLYTTTGRKREASEWRKKLEAPR